MQFRGRPVVPGGGPFVWGVLNVTPDSFSDGGVYVDASAAIDAGLRMADAGADVIDIGGESTRPGSMGVAPDEQMRRVMPVIEGLVSKPGADGPAISIDTRSAEVAQAAIAAGARVINDVSALRDDAEIAPLAASRGVMIVLMHMKGTPADMQKDPTYDDVVAEVRDFLHERMTSAIAAGVPRNRIIVDPGIGFGKTTAHNLKILANLEFFRPLGVPVMVGPSRKRFIGEILGIDKPRDRLMGTAAAVAACILAGVECVRVHDVAECRQVADVCAAIRAGK